MHCCRARGHFWSGIFSVVFHSNESVAGVVLELSESCWILSAIPADVVEMVARESAGIDNCCRTARCIPGGDGLHPDPQEKGKNGFKILTGDACGLHHGRVGTALVDWKEFGGSGSFVDPVSSLASLVSDNSTR